MLHIHNGDSSANTARQSSLPGEHFAWREALIEGPTPAGVEGEEWRRLRAKHLAESYGVELDKCERELLDQEQALARFPEHDEIVLWFEHDLFCQTNLLYLLNWFAQRDLGTTKLSLVCIGEFPGKPTSAAWERLNTEENRFALTFAGTRDSNAELKPLPRNASISFSPSESPGITPGSRHLRSSMPGRAFQSHLTGFPFRGAMVSVALKTAPWG